MSEGGPGRRICPYLRGRRQPQPYLQPSDLNHCIVAASIHLPQAQQSRFCLGGQYGQCSRFSRQQADIVPKYITGVPTEPPPPAVTVPTLPVLLWRRPFFRPLVMTFAILALVVIMVFGWRWRQDSLPAGVTPRPPLPTAIVAPTLQSTSPFVRPTAGPVPR